MNLNADVKNKIKTNKIIVGYKEVLEAVKLDKASAVILANNCPEEIAGDIEHNAELSQVEVIKFDGNGKALGELCKKPFVIVVLGIKK